MKCNETGCNCYRFDLHVDELAKISSNPEGAWSCWHPAIFPLSSLVPSESCVTKGNVVKIRSNTASNCLIVELLQVSRQPAVKSDYDTRPGPPLTPTVELDRSPDVHQKSELATTEHENDAEQTFVSYECKCGYAPANRGVTADVKALSDNIFYLKPEEIYRLDTVFITIFMITMRNWLTNHNYS